MFHSKENNREWRVFVILLICTTLIDHGDSMNVPSSFTPSTADGVFVYTEDTNPGINDFSTTGPQTKPKKTIKPSHATTIGTTDALRTSAEMPTTGPQTKPKKTTKPSQTTTIGTTDALRTSAEMPTTGPQTKAKKTIKPSQTTTIGTTDALRTSATKPSQTTTIGTTDALHTSAAMPTTGPQTKPKKTTKPSQTTTIGTTDALHTSAAMPTTGPQTKPKKTTKPAQATTIATTDALRTSTEMPTAQPPSPQTMNKFNFTQNGTSCILENISAKFSLHNETTNTTSLTEMTNAIVDTNRSQCGIKTSKKEAILTVSWKSPFGGNNSLAQKFSVDGNYYYLSDYSVSLVINVNKDILNASATVEDKDTFRTPFGKSLICDRGTNITYKRTDSQITLRLYDVKLQAFDAGKDFSDDQYECPKKNSQVYLIVVILFGVTVLVALMLAIFVYRRNTEHTRQGYGSMQ